MGSIQLLNLTMGCYISFVSLLYHNQCIFHLCAESLTKKTKAGQSDGTDNTQSTTKSTESTAAKSDSVPVKNENKTSSEEASPESESKTAAKGDPASKV